MSDLAPTPAQRLAVRQRPSSLTVMRQRWRGLLFLHWAVDPEIIAKRLPPGLHVDTYDGKAWLGVVPFFMDRVRPCWLPPVPGLSWFQELNVRTYVHDEHGRPGVWFFSLDCNQPIAVEIARRGFHLPYEHAAMNHQTTDSHIHYESRRKSGGSKAVFDYPTAANHTQPATEGTLEWFLVERYLLFSTNPKGEIFCGQVHHSPYQITPASCETWSAEPLKWNGFEIGDTPPESVLISQTVDVSIHWLQRVTQPPSASPSGETITRGKATPTTSTPDP